MTDDDPWDALSDVFSGDKRDDEMSAAAADNVLIAWPPMLEFLEHRQPRRVLDFGCGGGRLVRELHRRGYEAMGVDRSVNMIESARTVFGSSAPFEIGDADKVLEFSPLDAIVSVMVLQFVEDVSRAFTALTNSLTKDGLLVFAVHNPSCIEQSIERGTTPPFELTASGRRTTLALGIDTTIPLYIRTAEEYDEMLARCGFVRTMHGEPPFTQEFIDRYGTGSVDQSEYLILGYTRK